MKIMLTKDVGLDPKLFGEWVVQIDNTIWASECIVERELIIRNRIYKTNKKATQKEVYEFVEQNNLSLPTKEEIEKLIAVNRAIGICIEEMKPFWLSEKDTYLDSNSLTDLDTGERLDPEIEIEENHHSYHIRLVHRLK